MPHNTHHPDTHESSIHASMQVMIALAGPIRFVVKAWTSGGGQTSSDGLASGGSGASSDGRTAWPGLDGGGGGKDGLDGRAGFLFFICYCFVLPGVRKCT